MRARQQGHVPAWTLLQGQHPVQPGGQPAAHEHIKAAAMKMRTLPAHLQASVLVTWRATS